VHICLDSTKYSNLIYRYRYIVYVILVIFVGSAVLVAISGVPFATFYQTLEQETLGSASGLTYLITLTTILTLTGLSASIPFRASVWNIGGEGQLYIGALAATATMVITQIYNPIVVIVVGSVAGAAYAIAPAILKFKLKTDEIVTTLLLNFVAVYIVLYGVRVPLKAPGALTPESPAFPLLFPVASLLTITAIMAFGLYFVTERTTIGFEIQSVGRNIQAAKYAGINTSYIGILTMIVGGACAGMAGGILITSPILNSLLPGFSQMYGYVGIGVALIARLRALAIPFSAFLISMLFVTAKFLTTGTQIPLLFASAIVGLIMIMLTFTEKR
jgi:ABC-type uncharacterized transport system permease subunit